MATIVPAIKVRNNSSGSKDVIFTWTGLSQANPDGLWVSIPGMVLRAFGVAGTFGVAGSVSAKVSNGDAMQEKSTDPAPITGNQPDEGVIAGPSTAAGIVTTPMYLAAASYRPLVTVSDGTTNLTVTMYFIQD